MNWHGIGSIVLTAALIAGPERSRAQSMDDLNLQVHGYATQGFISSSNNNWDSTDSTGGSAAWTEAVVNITAQPESRLRIGVQARYFLLGNYGDEIELDWAQADYKVNEKFGFRVGKVKTPMGLLNQIQDIDPAYPWVLLPEGVYPVASRDSTLAHYGGVGYGTIPLSPSLGKLEYDAYGGQRVVQSDDGYLQLLSDIGMALPNGLTGRVFGGTLRWDTPIDGLMAGATVDSSALSGNLLAGGYPGTMEAPRFYRTYFFARYERKKLMFAGEYNRLPAHTLFQLPGQPVEHMAQDNRAFYAMTSYKVDNKLTVGAYYSSSINLQAPISSARYQKDWALSGRHDFNQFLYLKAEQHFIDGTEIGYSILDNPGGLRPNTRMTLLKLGVSF